MFQSVTCRGHGPGHPGVTTWAKIVLMKRAALLLALVLPAALDAQGPRHAFTAPAEEPGPMNVLADSIAPPSDLTLAFGGVLGGVGGLIAGGFIGAQLEMAGGCHGDHWCGFGGGILGAAIGSAVMIPAAVHLANGRRGSFAAGLGASVAALAGGVAISLVVQDAQPLLLVPVAQIIGAVAVERRTSRGKISDAHQADQEFQR